MNAGEVVRRIIEYIPSIDWTVSGTKAAVSLLETTIRYLGGLLSAYDLLSGPHAHLVEGKQKAFVPVLLDQARALADNLSYAFDTPTGVPFNDLDLISRGDSGAATNLIAGFMTLVLEWARLS